MKIPHQLISVLCIVEVDEKLKPLFDRIFVRQNLDNIEIPYFSSERFQIVCTFCACVCESSEPGKYPICKDCQNDGTSYVALNRFFYTNSRYFYNLKLNYTLPVIEDIRGVSSIKIL